MQLQYNYYKYKEELFPKVWINRVEFKENKKSTF